MVLDESIRVPIDAHLYFIFCSDAKLFQCTRAYELYCIKEVTFFERVNIPALVVLSLETLVNEVVGRRKNFKQTRLISAAAFNGLAFTDRVPEELRFIQLAAFEPFWFIQDVLNFR